MHFPPTCCSAQLFISTLKQYFSHHAHKILHPMKEVHIPNYRVEPRVQSDNMQYTFVVYFNERPRCRKPISPEVSDTTRNKHVLPRHFSGISVIYPQDPQILQSFSANCQIILHCSTRICRLQPQLPFKDSFNLSYKSKYHDFISGWCMGSPH